MKNWKTFKWASQPLTYHLTHTDNAINEKRQKKSREKKRIRKKPLPRCFKRKNFLST